MLFGISPLGWVHTLGGLPAIPAAAYMLAKHGRIVPRSRAGLVYFVSMAIGAVTVFLVTKQAPGYAAGAITLVLLFVGYGIRRVAPTSGATDYVETISLSLTVFLLMLPTVSETLRRVPDGHPLVADLKSPLLLGTQLALLVALVVGVVLQVLHLRKTRRTAAAGQT